MLQPLYYSIGTGRAHDCACLDFGTTAHLSSSQHNVAGSPACTDSTMRGFDISRKARPHPVAITKQPQKATTLRRRQAEDRDLSWREDPAPWSVCADCCGTLAAAQPCLLLSGRAACVLSDDLRSTVVQPHNRIRSCGETSDKSELSHPAAALRRLDGGFTWCTLPRSCNKLGCGAVAGRPPRRSAAILLSAQLCASSKTCL